MSNHKKSITVTRAERRRQWYAHVEACRQSSQTQRAYCECHQLGYASFQRWCRIVRDDERGSGATSTSGSTAFIPVAVVDDARDHRPGVCISLPSGARIDGISAGNVDVALALAAAL